MVYWIEYEKSAGVHERGGSTLTEALREAYSTLSRGRYGTEAYIYNGQKWIGTCYYSQNGSRYETVFGKSYALYENGRTSGSKKKREMHPFGL